MMTMEWIRGVTLFEWVRANCLERNGQMLGRAAEVWASTVSELGKDEAWLQGWLSEQPSRLGLGELEVAEGAGDDDSRSFVATDDQRCFSVDVRLGEMEASHGFQLLDNWARNRVLHPDKTHVAVPFFRDHFAKLDRQIVLVDVLSALESGPDALGELEASLDRMLAAFNVGANNIFSFLTGRRIERIAFAASKADHVNRAGHRQLTRILDKAVARAKGRGAAAGSAHIAVALAALRATEDVETQSGTERFASLRGRPMAGETIAGRGYTGRETAVVFPGDLPADPLDAFDAQAITGGAHRFVRFAPPRIADADAPWPHIGLDQIVRFLIADQLPHAWGHTGTVR